MAGYLHDLGKLAIPSEIIEKPGPLNQSERLVMRAHVYHTYQTLERSLKNGSMPKLQVE